MGEKWEWKLTKSELKRREQFTSVEQGHLGLLKQLSTLSQEHQVVIHEWWDDVMKNHNIPKELRYRLITDATKETVRVQSGFRSPGKDV